MPTIFLSLNHPYNYRPFPSLKKKMGVCNIENGPWLDAIYSHVQLPGIMGAHTYTNLITADCPLLILSKFDIFDPCFVSLLQL